MNRKKRILLIAGLVLALLGVVCGVYFGTYSRATPEATALLQGSDAVQVTAIHGGWLLDGPGTRDALIFYPGGKVEATAYLPLLTTLAADGIDCFLLQAPLNLAIRRRERRPALGPDPAGRLFHQAHRPSPLRSGASRQRGPGPGHGQAAGEPPQSARLRPL